MRQRVGGENAQQEIQCSRHISWPKHCRNFAGIIAKETFKEGKEVALQMFMTGSSHGGSKQGSFETGRRRSPC